MSKPSNDQDRPHDDWRDAPRVAKYWRHTDSDDVVECSLSPRHCKIAQGRAGFCGVRRNIDGTLYTDNYGKAVAAAEETIESEAIYHYRPGTRTLSMGNIGCMMACRFCQNWTTSQVRHLDKRVIQALTPDEVVRLAVDNGIEVISWTYNDPVVWQEFVVETSRIARDSGLRTLYKSALYIEAEPLAELLEVIDIWSISLKSLDPAFYKRVTGAKIEPILERIREIRASGRHLEISQLLVTGLNDNLAAIGETIDWHLDNLGEEVPLHFVRFHPAFRYLDVERTPRTILLQAAELARRRGVRHVYIGNLHERGVADTYCHACGATLITRFGLATEIVGISVSGHCQGCGAEAPITEPWRTQPRDAAVIQKNGSLASIDYRWSEEVNSIHVETLDIDMPPVDVFVDRDGDGHLESHRVGGRLSRALVSRRSDSEKQVTIYWPEHAHLRVVPVLDRAHLYTGEN